MNGVHDLGGMHGFGPVDPDLHEPPFHHDWERLALGLQVGGMSTGHWNADEFRFARERVDPATYLASRYYELWMEGLEAVLLEKGIATEADIARRQAIFQADPAASPEASFVGAAADPLPTAPMWQFRRQLNEPPGFAVGDRVRTFSRQPRGHTRLPRYARGKRGTVVRYHGAFDLADASADGEERVEHLYSVRFSGEEIWGSTAEPGSEICLDAWESYLEKL